VTQPDTTPIRQYLRRARIAQSSALPTVADEPVSPMRDVSEREACSTESGFIADQDRATIAKSSTLPHDSAPRAQEEEIVKLKERVKVLEDKEDVAVTQSGDDAPIKGRSINEGEAAAERISNDSEEIAKVLTSMDETTVLAGGIDVPTGSGFIPTAGPPATVISTGREVGGIDVPTGSGFTPTAGPPATVISTGREGEGLGTPTEPHHTPSLEAHPTSHTTHSSPTLPSVTTASIPTVTPSRTTPIRQYTRRARLAQSSALPPIAYEPASPLRDVSQGEAYPTDSDFGADQDRANISKTSTLPHDSAPRVTFPATAEGSMQQTLNELTAFCTSLQRKHSELISKFEAQELEINRLKARVKLLEDREGVAAERSGDDALIKGRDLDEEEAATERASDDTKEMATVLTSMDAATVLASRVAEVPTGSGSIPTARPPADEVPTDSDVVPTAGPIFATATVVTPYTRRKSKETMVESKTPKKKKIQEQMDIQMARQLEEEMERDAQRMMSR
nr:hypothetical protein [Tanacetum cinerariifolium]